MGISHRVGGTNTCWIFLAATQEARHLEDIIFCVDVLRRRGVSDTAILVFTDHPAARSHFDPYGIANVHLLTDVASVLAKQTFRYVVAICGGHGGQFGLEATGAGRARLSPQELFNAISSVQQAEVAIVFLCQCYAGVFHFMDATSGTPQYVLVGSTNFYPTISTLIRLQSPLSTRDGSPGLVQWHANLYQFSLFEWLMNPRDIDGDGEVNLVDVYKFAGVNTIARIQSVWVGLFADLRTLQDALASAEARAEPQVVLDAYRVSIRQTLSLLYNIQEPWLLHARLASQVGIV
ncbi:MAG TPA: hypothetical protein VHC69_11260 [Polyangiaceae bacterium]|nr:hypothetical protein [Polyangiaceae bacterium]